MQVPTITQELVIHREARFTKSGDRRIVLGRRWVDDEHAPYVLFVMLNPSTANAVKDDPTIRKCMGITKRLGYGALLVVNLFDYITPDPKALRRWVIAEGLGDRVDPCGPPPADLAIMTMLSVKAARTICGWGTWGGWFPERVKDVLECLTEPHALHVTKGGHPGHPLYLPSDAKPIPYRLP
jgi:hypothetical protein